MEKPVFIIGLHRTGSTLLKNIIDASNEIAMASDEMHLSTPWRRDTFSYHKRSRSTEDFLKKLFSGEPHGSFWNDLKKSNIEIPSVIDQLEDNKKKHGLKTIIDKILEIYAQKEGKERYGAKYPLHFSRISILFDWYPNCKVIHLTRDPRAIIASKLNDDATTRRKSKHPLLAPFVHWGTLFFFLFEYVWSLQVHKRHRDKKNYTMISYEDILLNPQKEIKKICDFCEIEFTESMMNQPGKTSSYESKRKRGIDVDKKDRWQDNMSRYEKVIISGLLGFFRFKKYI